MFDLIEKKRQKDLQAEIDKKVSRIREVSMAGLMAIAATGATTEEATLAIMEAQKLLQGRIQRRSKPFVEEMNKLSFKDLLADYEEEKTSTIAT